jgi:Fur family transcriptional regulator, ferric uptake regulator
MKQTRNTQAKSAIEQMIKESKEALSHHDIQSALGDLCNRVTTYRVLNRLIEDGTIHKMVDMDGVVKYASCDDKCDSDHSHSHTHVHFSCIKCHTVTCLDEIKPQFKLPTDYQVEEMNFTISGICPKCQ